MISKDIHKDRELFTRIAAGDPLAYTAIYDKYTGPLYSYVLKVLKAQFWAEEVIQDIFMNLWINREELKYVDNPSAFLYRMTANRTIDWIRKNDMEVRILYYTRHKSIHGINATEELVDFRASETLIKEAINNLAPQRKLIYKLKNENGLSYDEIALQLAISKHTVRNQLAKSIESIRSYLQQKGGIFLGLLSFLNYFR